MRNVIENAMDKMAHRNIKADYVAQVSGGDDVIMYKTMTIDAYVTTLQKAIETGSNAMCYIMRQGMLAERPIFSVVNGEIMISSSVITTVDKLPK